MPFPKNKFADVWDKIYYSQKNLFFSNSCQFKKQRRTPWAAILKFEIS